MEEPILQSDNPPTIIDLDSPEDQILPEDHMINELQEKEKERDNSPQMIDSDPSVQDLSPDFWKNPNSSPQSENESRDSDRRNVRYERNRNISQSPYRQHDEGESTAKETSNTTEITDKWDDDKRRVRKSSDAWGQQSVDQVHRSSEFDQKPVDRVRRASEFDQKPADRVHRASEFDQKPVDRVHRASEFDQKPVDRVHRSSHSPNERRPHRSHRNRSRSRSRSRSPRRTDRRSPVGENDRRAPQFRGNDRRDLQVRENDRRAPPVVPQPCRDFVAGRCRRGPQCRFSHPDGRPDRYGSRERERERGRGGEREFEEEMRGQQGRRGNYDEGRERERCFDFSKGRCRRGADCRFLHEEPAGRNNNRERDERQSNRERDRDERESYRGEREGGNNNRERDSSFERDREGRRAKKEEICKFFLEGRCGRGSSCRFSHDVAHQVHGNENDMNNNQSDWSSQNESGVRNNNQYIVPVTETVPSQMQNQYNVPVPVKPGPGVVSSYMGVNSNPNMNPNLQGYSNLQSVPVPNPSQMMLPVNPTLPPPPPGKPPNPNPSNLVTSEQAANITDISAYLSQILATNNSSVPVPVPAQLDLHESPITPPVETETLETKKEDGSKPNPNPNSKGGKEGKGLKLFKCALVEVVKDLLKPNWKDGQLSREVHKTIVKKVVDKVVGTLDNLPQNQEKIDVYLSHSKPKLMKLVQAYVEKYVKG